MDGAGGAGADSPTACWGSSGRFAAGAGAGAAAMRRPGSEIAERLALPEIVGRLLAQRGVDLDHAPGFLEPRLRDQLPDPSHLRDMEVAADRLARAVRDGERIAVFGDYDVDGATSAALLSRFFAAVGTPVRIYVPDRLREGYGPNAAALMRLRDEGVRLVVTVDCGTSAHQPLAAAAEAGIEIIVVDHHVAEPLLPRAAALINPNRLDETSPHRSLAAVGLAFLLVVAVNRALRRAGWYERARAEPDLLGWLDLVALGTVCDVVPLDGLNRALVAQGIKVGAARRQSRHRGALRHRRHQRAARRLPSWVCARAPGQCRWPGRRRRSGRAAAWRPTTRRWPPNSRNGSTGTTASAARSRRAPWRQRSRWSKRHRKPRS